MQEAANQSDARVTTEGAVSCPNVREGWDKQLCFPAEMWCFYLDGTKVSQRNPLEGCDSSEIRPHSLHLRSYPIDPITQNYDWL